MDNKPVCVDCVNYGVVAQLRAECELLRAALQKIADYQIHGWTLQTGIARDALGEEA